MCLSVCLYVLYASHLFFLYFCSFSLYFFTDMNRSSIILFSYLQSDFNPLKIYVWHYFSCMKLTRFRKLSAVNSYKRLVFAFYFLLFIHSFISNVLYFFFLKMIWSHCSNIQAIIAENLFKLNFINYLLR